jgi:site-specific recombinase XerD
MRPPIVPEEPPAILRETELKAIFDACSGSSFEDRRDTGIVRLLLDTGMRRAELAGLKVGDVDLDHQVAIVIGKGRRPRACPFGSKTAQALDRYLRLRLAHPHAQRPELWLAPRGALNNYDPCRDRRKLPPRLPPGARNASQSVRLGAEG